ncbi:MAG: hypothetical protein IKO48_01705 [Elusimicrobia bacterium]|nr:hypothetical protein [Elusimicrobiota bacterium]
MERHGQTLYPLCEVLYKKDNSEGWYFGCMGGEEEECKKKCEELKKEYSWYDYKCFVKSWWVVKPATKFQIYTPRADSMHETSNFIYSTQEQKYYYPEEIIPYPKKETEIDDNFKITIKGEGEDDNVWEPEDEEDFNEKTEVLILFGSTEYENFVLADYMIEDIKPFIDRLEKENYSNLSVLEYTNTKLLAWKKDNTVRLIIQNYNDDDIIIEYDKLIPENIFYREFNKLYEKLGYYINRRVKIYEEFKKQEKFLHSLKWIYDKQNVNIPCEYILFEDNKDKIETLKAFAKQIHDNAEVNEYCGVPYANIHLGEYLYWLGINENSIYRTYSYSSRYLIEDIKKFIKSNVFEYKENMPLSDIANQSLDKGYYYVTECTLNDKDFKVYLNGQVESEKGSQEECKQLEETIKEIYRNYKNKEKFSVSILWNELTKHYTHCGLCGRDTDMIMKIKV